MEDPVLSDQTGLQWGPPISGLTEEGLGGTADTCMAHCLVSCKASLLRGDPKPTRCSSPWLLSQGLQGFFSSSSHRPIRSAFRVQDSQQEALTLRASKGSSCPGKRVIRSPQQLQRGGVIKALGMLLAERAGACRLRPSCRQGPQASLAQTHPARVGSSSVSSYCGLPALGLHRPEPELVGLRAGRLGEKAREPPTSPTNGNVPPAPPCGQRPRRVLPVGGAFTEQGGSRLCAPHARSPERLASGAGSKDAAVWTAGDSGARKCPWAPCFLGRGQECTHAPFLI